jgi:acetyl-CoA synthetase
LKTGVTADEELHSALIAFVVASQGKPLAPKTIEFVSELPKTRNAKVLRRIVRAVYLGNDPGDLSSLENRSAIESIERVRSPV